MNDIHFGMTPDIPPIKPDKRKETILAAARQHFATHGFEATKLADVARDAEVAVGTIYLRYAGKSELLGGVLHAVEESFSAAFDTQEIWLTPFPARFDPIMRAVIEHALGTPDLGALMALKPFAATQTGGDGVRNMIARHLTDGVERGELRAGLDVALASQLAHGMVEGGMVALMRDPSQTPERVAKELALASERWLA